MGGMGFDMGYEGEGGEPGGGEGVFSGYILQWENTSDQTEADTKSKKAPPMITIEDTPLRGPVTGEEVAEAPTKEPVAMPPCRAGKVIHSNPWRWPNLWDEDDESTQYQYYLWGASMMNYGADHGQQLNGSGMAGLSGAARGIAHFRYIGIPVNPEGIHPFCASVCVVPVDMLDFWNRRSPLFHIFVSHLFSVSPRAAQLSFLPFNSSAVPSLTAHTLQVSQMMTSNKQLLPNLPRSMRLSWRATMCMYQSTGFTSLASQRRASEEA